MHLSYLRVTLDTQLTWSIDIHQIGKKAAQRQVMPGRLFSISSELIPSMVAYTCCVWKSAARSHVRKLQIPKSKCFGIGPNASWYLSKKQIQENLAVPVFADQFGNLEGNWAGKIWWHLPEAFVESDWESAGQSWLPVTRRPSRQNEVCLAICGYLDRYFPWFFSVVRQITGYN